jgi:hypothetical protein
MTDHAVAPVDFTIVGSARSGTTLVQRLAGDLDGVRTPPETHFFDLFLPALLAEQSFPLDEDGLRSALKQWANLEQCQGIDAVLDAIAQSLGGRCTSPGQLFNALVAHLTPDAEIRGEKTPGHVRWWRPLARHNPSLVFVVVVRDPRAVVASSLTVPWGAGLVYGDWGAHLPLGIAYRWRETQRDARELVTKLAHRSILLRYEDIVRDPDSATAKLGQFLGARNAAAGSPRAENIVLPWESWKLNALGPVSEDRIDGWRETLTPTQAAMIATLCRSPMTQFGYDITRAESARAAAGFATLPPRTIRQLRGFRRILAAERRAIEATTL